MTERRLVQTRAIHSADSVRGMALNTFIVALFGLFWGLAGTAGLPPPFESIGLLVVLGITLALVAIAFGVRHLAGRFPSSEGETAVNPFRTRAYGVSVLLMVLAFPIASIGLRTTGFADALISVSAIIVGLHFFGLVRAFDSQRFALVGGAMCLVGVISLGLPVHVSLATGASLALRQTIVGIGCALVLWISILGTTIPMWRAAR